MLHGLATLMGARLATQRDHSRHGAPHSRVREWATIGTVALLTGCLEAAPVPTAPPALTASVATAQATADARPVDRCLNVAAQGVAPLAFPVTLPNGTTGSGGAWSALSLGGISGEMASVLVSAQPSGSKGQGAAHWVLEHAFRTAAGDYFVTRDRAVCAPAGANPATCRVNDVLTIVEGAGIFANANGTLRNHGTIDFIAGTLDFSIRGRICGDGL